LAHAIRRTVGERVALVDSAETTAAAVAEALTDGKLAEASETSGRPEIRFFATDSPERFARVGAIFLGHDIDAASVELVDLRKT